METTEELVKSAIVGLLVYLLASVSQGQSVRTVAVFDHGYDMRFSDTKSTVDGGTYNASLATNSFTYKDAQVPVTSDFAGANGIAITVGGASNRTVTIDGLAVLNNIVAGADISITVAGANYTIANTSTLQTVTGRGAVSSNAISLTAAGTALSITNNATVGGTLGVTGAVTGGAGSTFADLAVTGASTLSGAVSATAAGTGLSVTNNATIGGTLGVTGNSTLGVLSAGASTLASASVTGNLTVSGGDVTLNNGTSNAIQFGTNGVAAPGAGSAGMKLKLYGGAGAMTASDYGFGIEAGYLWANAGNSSAGHKWYAGSTLAATMTASSLSLSGSVSVATTLGVTGASTLTGDVSAGGALSVAGVSTLTNGATIKNAITHQNTTDNTKQYTVQVDTSGNAIWQNNLGAYFFRNAVASSAALVYIQGNGTNTGTNFFMVPNGTGAIQVRYYHGGGGYSGLYSNGNSYMNYLFTHANDTNFTVYNTNAAYVANLEVEGKGVYGTTAVPASTSPQLEVVNGTAANTGLRVKGAASQTGDLQEWTDSAGTEVARVEAGGTVKGLAFQRATVLHDLSYTADYTGVQFVDPDTGGVDMTVTLPTAVGKSGVELSFIRVGSSSIWNCQLDGNGAETINGVATHSLTAYGHAATLVSDGSNWWIKSKIPAP